MSTKKKLIEAAMFTRQGLYSDVDNTQNLVRLRWTLDLYILKQNTKITKEILLKNGFEIHPPFHGYYVLRTPKVNLEVEWDKDGCYWSDAILRNVADLEDALDLCGIDKEIELL
ncbi:MAG: hypothetical protein MJZ30_05870 [Paludibacteraceae bacterium]|nr:hypothetical protein [Paludibacteraceae bacterium]